MRKTILSLIALLIGAVAAYSQPDSWKYVGDNAYGYSHMVYAGLVDSSGTAVNYINDYWLGAFIDGECRGVAQAEQYPSEGDPTFMYFSMRIWGEATDNGKTVTFRLMNTDGWEFVLDQTLAYSNEGTEDKPSSLFPITFQQPLYFTFPDTIKVKVDESVDLKSLVTFAPANANVPTSFGKWDFMNSSNYINVSNDTLKGLNPFLGAYLGMPSAFNNLKSMNGNYYATVNVIRPATGIAIKPEYANGATVYKGDFTRLTNILDSCYTLTPADANEEVSWTWSPEEGIKKMVNSSTWYWPRTAGDYKMEVKVGDYSATMALTVLNKVDTITAVTDTIHLFVGDNLSELMPHTVKFTPSEYVNKELNYSVYNGNTPALQADNDNIWRAVAEGEATLQVSSPEKPNSPVIIPIMVHPNITDVEIYKQTLTYEYKQNDTTDITRDVMNNFTFIPGKDYTIKEGELTTSNDSVCGITYYSNIWNVYTDKLGSATLRVSHSAQQTTLVGGALVTNTISACDSFVVRVVQGLYGFTFDNITMGRNDWQTLTLVPEPENAEFDGSLVTVTITGGNDFPQGWTLAEAAPQTNDQTGLEWVITPQAVGTGFIKVCYNGDTLTTKAITIGQSFTQKEGWAWVTPYGGYVQSIETLYGDKLHEMRSQSAVMYNDPVYGYFGALGTMSPNQCYKVKIKEGESVEAFNSDVEYDSEFTIMRIKDKWNWIGFPYQYDHALSEVFANPNGGETTFTTGDRIVSKDNGFAEYDGTEWTGSLTTLSFGEGYLFYNASGTSKQINFQSELVLGQPSASATQALSKGWAQRASVWQYNSAQFSDNMTIVADLGAEYADSRYSVGAFIGDECRGEGMFVNGKWFITVHGGAGDQGQSVTFRVYDTMDGSVYVVDNSQPYATMSGTLRSPLRMMVGELTGINGVTAAPDNAAADSELYTIDGKRVIGQPAPGIYVVKQNGKTRKVLVK